jgi:hypothetical protein
LEILVGAGISATISEAKDFIRDSVNEINPKIAELSKKIKQDRNNIDSWSKSRREVGKKNIENNLRARDEDVLKSVRIVLIGHSRGAVACIDIANTSEYPIYFMGLYDAVDKSFLTDASTEFVNSKKVAFTYHAIRDYEKNGSRQSSIPFASFNSATEDIKMCSEKYMVEFFNTAHGGVGGDYGGDNRFYNITADTICVPEKISLNTKSITIPIVNVNVQYPSLFFDNSKQRSLCVSEQKRAKDWMQQKARDHGIPVDKH